MSPSKYLHKSHNVSVLLYHVVCFTKYRCRVLSPKVSGILVSACEEISLGYEIEFLEIGVDKDHAHFLIQSSLTYSPTKIVRTIKSLISRFVFEQAAGVKRAL